MLDEMGSAILFELRGENPGAIHRLSEEVFRIGSDSENNLILKDPGVALYQTEINLLDRQYVIRNLSLEGTAFLNGETFEETLLQKGDILTLGDSMFRFVAQGEALTQEVLWQPVGGKQKILRPRIGSFRRVFFLMGFSVIAMGVVVFIMFTQSKKVEKVTREASVEIAKVSSATDRKELDSLYNRGVDYYSAKRWDEAILIFDAVRKETPNYKDVADLYQQAHMESRILDQVNQGKGLFTEGQWVQAKEIFNEVPEKSFYYREVERLIREIDVKIVEIRLRNAKRFLALKDWENARREAEAVLSKDPNNDKALRIQKEALRMMAGTTKKWYQYSENKTFLPEEELPPSSKTELKEANDTEMKISSSESSKSKPAHPSPPRGTPAWNLDRALSAYNKGDPDTSLHYLEKVMKSGTGRLREKARMMADNLRSAASYYHQAHTLQNEGRYAEALEMWEKFLEKDRSISTSKKGSFFQKASTALGVIYFQRGEMAFHSGDLARASRFWRMAKKIDPQDKDVKKGLVMLSEKAQIFYREGYSLQEINPERAIEKWKVVLDIVPPDHAYYKKAKRLVDRYAVIP